MFPTLFSFGPITISTLGVFLGLGFVLAAFVIWKRGKEEGYIEEQLIDGAFFVALAGLLGARLWYVLWHFSKFDQNIFKGLLLVKLPGFSWPGAFLAGLLALAFYSYKKKWNFFKIADIFVFGLCLGQIFGLIGSFFDGSFYGRITQLPWGVRFPGLEDYRHPTQIYLLLFVVLIFRLLFYFDKNYRTYIWYKDKRGEAAPGFLFSTYLMLFSFASLFVSFSRQQELIVFLNISLEQFFWLLTFFTAFGLLYSRSGLEIHKRVKAPLSLREEKEPQLLNDYREPVRRRKIKKSNSRFKKGMEAK